MSPTSFAAGALAAVLCSASAQAISITNHDDKDQKITVIEGDKKADHVLKAGQVLDAVCLKGCVLRLNDSENDEYELEGPEVVSIEEGVLYYEGPEAPTQPSPEPGKPEPKPGAPK
jgi:hypothetical protein